MEAPPPAVMWNVSFDDAISGWDHLLPFVSSTCADEWIDSRDGGMDNRESDVRRHILLKWLRTDSSCPSEKIRLHS